ncbi:MFS transporter [Streptomyces sp. cg36]|uniref:MFS transporter n=1 Tax=Streptomyces sp. cg36 TaxID=3238798 RepID=UPI0034E2DC69
MPHLMTVSGSTLVLAAPGPRTSAPAPHPATARRTSAPAPPGPRAATPAPPAAHPPTARSRSARLSPYRRLFAVPGARAFTLGNLVARLPMGMFGVSAVIMIAGQRGSYALAGAVTATGLVATALVAPWTARLVDRHGQARVGVPATALAVLGSLALVLCVRLEAPAWTLFASYALTATTPNTGGMSRARWAHVHRGDPAALHTAHAFEQAVDELCFLLGPVAAAFLCTALFPEAGTLTGAVLLMTGMLVFAAQRATEPPVAAPTGARSALRSPGLLPLLAVFLATGAVFGSMEVVTLAYASGLGHGPAGGAVLALQAAGSGAAGLLHGGARPARSLPGRLLLCVGAMAALMWLPLLAAGTGSLAVLAGALLLAGAATAPTMATGTALVQRLTPADRLNEGMALAVTAILAGIAAGSAAGGRLTDHAPAPLPYLAPAGAAALALLVCAAGPARRPGGGARATRAGAARK